MAKGKASETKHRGDGGANQGHLDTDEPVKIDSAAQALIGQQLKAMYSDLVRQEIPDDLIRLLDELEAKEGKT